MSIERTGITRPQLASKQELQVEGQEVGGLELLNTAERLQLQADWDDAVADAWFAEGENLPPEKQVYAEQQPGSVAWYTRAAWGYFRKWLDRPVSDPAEQRERARSEIERRFWFKQIGQAFDTKLANDKRKELITQMIGRTVTVNRQMYTIERFLGQGSFGLVFHAALPDGQPVVIKLSNTFDRSFLNRPLSKKADADVAHQTMLARSTVVESAILHRLGRATNNVYFPKFYGAALWKNPDWQPGQTDERITVQVMEEIEGVSLDAQLRQYTELTAYPEYAEQLVGELVDAVDQMHQAKVVHLDLKPANIMLRDGHPVIIDYGTGVLSDKREPTSQGTRRHWADESNAMYTKRYITKAEIDSASTARDVYALGVIIHDMIYGRPRALDIKIPADYESYRQQRYADLSRHLQTLSRIADQMIQTNPEKRWNLDQVKNALADLDAPTAVLVDTDEEVA